jgi:hypothetical protein
MKISVITYHYSCNNGAVMQTYALCRFLKENGHEVSLIDIRQDEREKQPFIVKFVKYFVFGYRINKIVKNYYPPLSKRYMTVEDLRNNPPEADCYIVGSDQVWNPAISKEQMLAYFLDFGDDKVRRVSYASSFGISEWPVKDPAVTNRVRDLLYRFSSLAVRETQGKEICKKTFGLEAKVVLDPTFLNYDYKEFNGGVKQTEDFVCYKLNRTEDFWNHTQKVASIIGSKPLLLNYNYPKKGFVYCFPPSLRTWMRKLAGAKFILTDSFHGIAFSIINRKQFVVILNDDGKNSRLIDLMNLMGLQNRVFNSVKDMVENRSWLQPIDYSNLEPVIRTQIEQSRAYLIGALKK